MDHHVPSAIFAGLDARGINVVTALAEGHENSPDIDILRQATATNRIVFTQDEDFLILAKEFLERGEDFAGIVFAPQLTTTIGSAIRDLELVCRVLIADDIRNKVIFLPL